MTHMRFKAPFSLMAALALGLTAQTVHAQTTYGGAGWMQIGKITESYTTDVNNPNYLKDNWLQNAGVQLSINTRIDENWEGALALGVVQVHLIRGIQSYSNWYPFSVPYVGEARVTYKNSFSEGDNFKLSLGLVPYGYNPDAKNLGNYLLRGYVYPGALVSGFGNIMGGVVSYEKSKFRNDLIVNMEMEDKPLYDVSIADVFTFKATEGLEFAAGVNFYRVIAQDSRFTSPDADNCYVGVYPDGSPGSSPRPPCYVIDTTGGTPDTVEGSLAGTKLIGRVGLDPKAVFGFSSIGGLALGKSDLKLYGEVGVIGVKDYAIVYDDILQRMPVMVGFNFPVFGILDVLSLEVEYYASKNSSDNLAAQFGSWVPVQNTSVDNARDDWKWSVNASKVIMGNLQLSGQVANDHLRVGGSHDVMSGVEALTTPDDWYWTAKLAYFF